MKNILITGSSSGLGKSLFFQLKKKFPKSNFYLISRNPQFKFSEVNNNNSKLVFYKCDLSNINSCIKIIKNFGSINFDLIVNNAGRIYSSKNFQKNLNLNAFSQFYLSYNFIKKKRKIKIININSFYHTFYRFNEINLKNFLKKKSLFSLKAYSLSKLFSLVLFKYLENKFSNKCIIFNINPGIVRSNFQEDTIWIKKLFSKLLRIFVGNAPNNISKEIIKIIYKNPKTTRSKYLYNKFNKGNKLVDDKQFQNKIFNIVIDIYGKN